jgi:NAD(P)-dependent dehydrogenase (short-subunit alcohol dehydrogenase family)
MKRDRVVVITGAAGGIGAKIVDRFISNQDTVFAIDNRPDALRFLQDAHQTCDGLFLIDGDVSREEDCRRFADAIRSKAGHIDVLINCAGYYPVVLFEEMSLADWQQVIGINLNGPFLMVSNLLPLMKGRGWDRIVNIGSASIFEGVPGQAHYVAAKSGIVGFSRTLAMELGAYGITVNVVAPGLTVTEPVRREMPAEMIESQRDVRALKRDEQPEDLAGPVFFLASPDADFISGQILVVDGGKIKH